MNFNEQRMAALRAEVLRIEPEMADSSLGAAIAVAVPKVAGLFDMLTPLAVRAYDAECDAHGAAALFDKCVELLRNRPTPSPDEPVWFPDWRDEDEAESFAKNPANWAEDFMSCAIYSVEW